VLRYTVGGAVYLGYRFCGSDHGVCGTCGGICGMLCGMVSVVGRKTSVYLPDDLAERVRASGVPMAVLIRRGLDAGEPEPLEDRLAAVIRAEFEARFRPGSAVMPDLPLLIGDADGVAHEAPARRARAKPSARRLPDAAAGLVTAEQRVLSSDQGGDYEPPLAPAVKFSEPDPVPVVTPSLRRASDLPVPARCPHKGVRITGGWCVACQGDVKPGGRLPDGWVRPEGWTES
jgi:hypothetical protein